MVEYNFGFSAISLLWLTSAWPKTNRTEYGWGMNYDGSIRVSSFAIKLDEV